MPYRENGDHVEPAEPDAKIIRQRWPAVPSLWKVIPAADPAATKLLHLTGVSCAYHDVPEVCLKECCVVLSVSWLWTCNGCGSEL